MEKEPVKKAYCGRCHRLLKNPQSVEIGYGPQCLKVMERTQTKPLFEVKKGDV